MNTTDLKASEFITSYTKELEGKKYIDAVGAIIELYSRILVIQNAIKDIHVALSDYGAAGIEFDKRLCELEGKKKIEIVSPDEANKLLKG
jgi:hypothetical protein